MRLRQPATAEPVPANLASFHLADWWDPELDGDPPRRVAEPGPGTLPQESRAERLRVWHCARAFRRYQNARREAGLTP